MGMFDGQMSQEDREHEVIVMLGRPSSDFDDATMRRVARELLAKAEKRAENWLREEISECMRGERHRMLNGHYGQY